MVWKAALEPYMQGAPHGQSSEICTASPESLCSEGLDHHDQDARLCKNTVVHTVSSMLTCSRTGALEACLQQAASDICVIASWAVPPEVPPGGATLSTVGTDSAVSKNVFFLL